MTRQLSKNEPFSLKILSKSLISKEYDPGGGGVLPYIIHIGMVAPKGMVLASFWSEIVSGLQGSLRSV